MNLEGHRSRNRIYTGILIGVIFALALIAYADIRPRPFVTLIALIGIACIAYGVFIEPRLFVVRRYRVPLTDDPKAWIRIVFLSDFHAGSGRSRQWFETIALEVQALDPDVVFLGGDFVADRADAIEVLQPLQQLRAHIGKYFVLGNHDFLDSPRQLRRTIASWGYADLTNRNITIQKGDRELQLSGLDDHWRGNPAVPVCRGTDRVPHVTLAHEPDAVLDMDEKSTDLVLAGHTHGGQIRLPLIGPLSRLPAILGRLADRGMRTTNGVRLIVSAGVAETDMQARFLCRPEIVVVEVGV